MPLILHAADLHLDSPLLGLSQYEGAPAARIRHSSRRALENMVALALERRVDLVLLAGDLFDGNWLDMNTGLYFARQMSRLGEAGIPVVAISGNHDAQGRLTATLRMPDNFRRLDPRQPESVTFDNIGVAIHGQSYNRPDVRENLAANYPTAIPGLVNIGLLHTALTGADGHEPYAPCTLDDLKRRGYDYWALGHIHAGRTVQATDPTIVYPGVLQGRHARETGPKGCILVESSATGIARHEFVMLDEVRWDVRRIAPGANERGLDGILASATEAMRRAVEGAEGRPVMLRAELLANRDDLRDAAAHHGQLVAELRRLANDASGGEIWLEKVKVLAGDTGVANVPGVASLGDGFAQALAREAGLLSRQGAAALADDAALSALVKSLPAEVVRDVDDWPAAVDEAHRLLLELVAQPRGGKP